MALLLSGCGAVTDQAGTATRATLGKVDSDGQPVQMAWVGFRDGDGPWEPITARDERGFYSHAVKDAVGRYAFASVNPAESNLDFYAATLAETRSVFGLEPVKTLPHAATVSGAVTSVPGGQSWSGTVVNRFMQPQTAAGDSYQAGVRAYGRVDLLAARRRGTVGTAVDRLWMQRDLTINGDKTQAIDFEQASQADAGEKTRAVLNDAGMSAFLIAGGAFYSTGNAQLNNGWIVKPGVMYLPMQLWYQMPTAAFRQATDAQCLWGDTKFFRQTACAVAGEAVALDYTGLQIFRAPTLTGSRVSWAAYEGAQLYEVKLTPASGLQVTIAATPGAAGTAPGFTLPDLTGVSGWKSSWMAVPAADTTVVTGEATASNQSLEQLILQRSRRRLQAGLRLWQAYSDPSQDLAQGVGVLGACDTCTHNCQVDPACYECLGMCELVCPTPVSDKEANQICRR